MKKLYRGLLSVVLFCALACLFTSCGAGGEIQGYAKYLTQPALTGRYPGTPGNTAAAEYLAQQLNTFGYVPLDSAAMLTPFAAQAATECETTLTVGEAVLVPNVDYIRPIGKNFVHSGTLTKTERGFAAVNEAGENTIEFVPQIKRLADRFEAEGSTPTVYLTKSGTKKIQGALGKTAAYTGTSTVADTTWQNVIGVLPGADRTRAVIIGAHFDHMGAIEGTDYVFHGASDNVSGTATALAVANALKGSTPPVDIVIAFWNAEEFGLQGSKAGAALLEGHYASYGYLNLDVLGSKNSKKIAVFTDNDSVMACDFLVQKMIDAGYDNLEASSIVAGGDHQNFTANVSISFIQGLDMVTPWLHTPEDTLDKLNFNELANFAKAFSTVIKENANALTDNSMQTKSNLSKKEFNTLSDYEKNVYSSRVAKSLALDEYAMLPDSLVVVNPQTEAFADTAALQAIYPQIEVAQATGDFTLKSLRVSAIDNEPRPNKIVFEKPYKRNFATETFFSIEAIYVKGEQTVKYSLCPGFAKEVSVFESTYGTPVPVEGKNETYLYTDTEMERKTLVMLGEKYAQVLTTGGLLPDEDVEGAFVFLSNPMPDDEDLLPLLDIFPYGLIKIRP